MQIGCHGSVWTGTFDRDGSGSPSPRPGGRLRPHRDPPDGPRRARRQTHPGGARRARAGGDRLARPHAENSTSPVRTRRSCRPGEAPRHAVLEAVSELGGTHLVGVIYCAMRKYSRRPRTSAGSTASRTPSAGSPREASELGVRLGVEVVNRYESNLLNTSRQAVATSRRSAGATTSGAPRHVPHEHRGAGHVHSGARRRLPARLRAHRGEPSRLPRLGHGRLRRVLPRRSPASATTGRWSSSRSPRRWCTRTSAACSPSGATSGRTRTTSARTRTPSSATSWRPSRRSRCSDEGRRLLRRRASSRSLRCPAGGGPGEAVVDGSWRECAAPTCTSTPAGSSRVTRSPRARDRRGGASPSAAGSTGLGSGSGWRSTTPRRAGAAISARASPSSARTSTPSAQRSGRVRRARGEPGGQGLPGRRPARRPGRARRAAGLRDPRDGRPGLKPGADVVMIGSGTPPAPAAARELIRRRRAG